MRVRLIGSLRHLPRERAACLPRRRRAAEAQSLVRQERAIKIHTSICAASKLTSFQKPFRTASPAISDRLGMCPKASSQSASLDLPFAHHGAKTCAHGCIASIRPSGRMEPSDLSCTQRSRETFAAPEGTLRRAREVVCATPKAGLKKKTLSSH